ncbi:MAG TPA: hypothetical protein VEO74_12820 [Thermoanaerobaculia bacterium]|nr:hypothetical protein [Thermoanaerobaculia bacterium]
MAALAGDPSDERVIEPLARNAVAGFLLGRTRRLGAAPHLRAQVVDLQRLAPHAPDALQLVRAPQPRFRGRGQHDHALQQVRRILFEMAEHREAVDARHDEIEKDHYRLGSAISKRLERAVAILGDPAAEPIALHDGNEQRANAVVILDDENRSGVHHGRERRWYADMHET